MNRADGECLPLFISSSGIECIYFPAMIIVSTIKRQRLKSLVLFLEFKMRPAQTASLMLTRVSSLDFVTAGRRWSDAWMDKRDNLKAWCFPSWQFLLQKAASVWLFPLQSLKRIRNNKKNHCSQCSCIYFWSWNAFQRRICVGKLFYNDYIKNILQFFYSRIVILGLTPLIFCAACWEEFSSSALIVLLRLMIRFSYSNPFLPHCYKQQLIFHNKLHDRKRLQVHLRFSVGYFILCILCGVQKCDDFLTSSPPCAASESVKAKFFLLVFYSF